MSIVGALLLGMTLASLYWLGFIVYWANHDFQRARKALSK